MRNSILLADLHLNTNPRDAYRWELFMWLGKECKKAKASRVFILGDLTDDKDRHTSVLVNSVVQALTGLVEYAELEELIVLRGNHDGIDAEWPYFRFLNELPRIRFVHEPEAFDRMLLLPHSRDPIDDWGNYDFSTYDCVLAHVTMQGSLAENGQELQGVSTSTFKHARKVWSGDVHVPQVRGKVEYVGSPYHVRFGDKFVPRCVWLDAKGAAHDLHFPSPRRWMLNFEDEKSAVRKGDQVKVRVKLTRSEYGQWKDRKKEVEEWAKRASAELVSVELVPTADKGKPMGKPKPTKSKTPQELLDEFCRKSKVTAAVAKAGKEMLE